MNKKAQIKLFESIAVLVIFIIIVAIGVRFYASVQMSSLREAQNKFSKLDAVKTSILISNMPEISCSFEGITDTSCIDLYKIRAWEELTNDPDNLRFLDYYYTQLGRSLITVQILYPEQRTLSVYNQSENISSDFLMVPSVVHVPTTKENHLGLLNIRTYYD